jgi:hypothetical protein
MQVLISEIGEVIDNSMFFFLGEKKCKKPGFFIEKQKVKCF